MIKTNNKDLKKQLIAAIAMVVVAALALGSSTYAWFAMNSSVTATGMQVSAKSSSAYLLISDDENVATNKSLGATSKAAYTAATDFAVVPCAFVTTQTEVSYTPASGTSSKITVPANSFYTATNGNAAAVNDSLTAASTVTEGASGYMVIYKVWLTLNKGSTAVSGKKMDVNFALGTTGTNDASTSAVVKIGSEYLPLSSANASKTTTADVDITDAIAVPVIIYMYVDGNSTNVYTDYLKDPTKSLQGTCTISFKVHEAS